MKRTVAFVLSVLVTTVTAAEAPLEERNPSTHSTGTLNLAVALIDDDLALHAVARKQFAVECEGEERLLLTTDFVGTAQAKVPAGACSISSVTPVSFRGNEYTWILGFVVENGGAAKIELSNDNASRTARPAPAQRIPMDEGELYRQYIKSVFTVFAEHGHGSGFLVDERGLVLTNHHVVEGSEYLAVGLDPTHKYEAQLLVEDAANDLAIVLVNQAVTRDIASLPLSNDTAHVPALNAGERVVALGSPLVTEGLITSGLISKVETEALYSDININPGNSGGPLLNEQGEVVGINTFIIQGASGQGISGAVRAHLAQPLIDRGLEALTGATLPSTETLPVESSFRFPARELREIALSRDLNSREYHLEGKRFDVQFMTPVLISLLRVESEKRALRSKEKRNTEEDLPSYVPGRDFYEWRKYAGDYRPIVVIHAIPEIVQTAKSGIMQILVSSAYPSQYRFKADFQRMELRRNGAIVEPLWPRRNRHVFSTVSISDISYYGAYQYPPEAFKPGAEIELRVWAEGDPPERTVYDPDGPAGSDPEIEIGPDYHVVPKWLVRRIWDDFEQYFLGFQRAAGQSEGRPSLRTDEQLVFSLLRSNGKWWDRHEILIEVPLFAEQFDAVMDSLIRQGLAERKGAKERYRSREP